MSHPTFQSTRTEKKTYIAIGDVHGCHRELKHLIQVLTEDYNLADPNVQLVFLGDYIDRGDSSMETIKTLMDIKKSYPQTVLLMGNHEQTFLEDGIRTFNDIPEPTPEHVTKFLESLEIYYETPRFLFIHGGPGSSESELESETQHDLLWNYIPDNSGWRGKTIVKGHTVVKRPTLLGKVLYLDSGCCFGGVLSCAIIDGQSGEITEFKQVKRVGFHGDDRRKPLPTDFEVEPIAKVIPLKVNVS